MSLVLNTNISSLVSQNNLSSSGAQLASSLQQLSSGLRINTAADDAAGYAIVQGMTSQINGINQAARNANDGVSLSQTASGALTEIVNDLQTMRDLAVQSLNATNSDTDRADLDAQFQQLKADINNVASQTQFNGVNLLDGTFQGATFQVGANAGQSITMSSISSAAANNLGQLFTAAATDPTAYSASGAAVVPTTNPAVAAGDAGSLTVTLGTKTYTTSSVTLTGDQATDLKTIAAAINQATGAAGVVATVDSTGKGIDISSTTSQTVALSYAATKGTETLATFGLKASNTLGLANPGFQTAAAATGVASGAYTTALGAGAGSDQVTLTVGGHQLSAITLSGNQATDLAAIQAAISGSAAGVTATVNANGGIDFTSATSQTVAVSAVFSGTGGGTNSSAATANTGTAGAYNATNVAADFGTGTTNTFGPTHPGTVTLSVDVDGGGAVNTSAITITGDAATDLAAIASAVTTALNGTGITATANGTTGLSFSGGTATHVMDFAVVSGTDADTNALVTNPTLADLGVDSEDTETFTPATTGTAAQGSEGLGTLGLSASYAVTTAAPAGNATPSGTVDTSDVKTVDDSNKVLISIDQALQQLANSGAQLGAYQNRFQSAVMGLNTDATNLTSARSQIQDTDYAAATSALSKAQILQQASTAMVAQANTIPQNILTLLQKLP